METKDNKLDFTGQSIYAGLDVPGDGDEKQKSEAELTRFMNLQNDFGSVM